jgi:hypothetical protein
MAVVMKNSLCCPQVVPEPIWCATDCGTEDNDSQPSANETKTHVFYIAEIIFIETIQVKQCAASVESALGESASRQHSLATDAGVSCTLGKERSSTTQKSRCNT